MHPALNTLNNALGLLLVVTALLLLPSKLLAAQKDPSLVVLFGDSITYGYAARGNGNGLTDVGEPDRALQRLFDDSRRSAIVSNFGSGGTATGPAGFEGLIAENNGVERVLRDLQTSLSLYPSTSDRYVVILYGFNDRNWGIPNSVTGQNIDTIIRRARSLGFTPVVGTIAPCNNCGNNTIVARNGFITSVVSSLNGSSVGPVYLVDQYNLLFGNIANLLLSDGIHPNTQGHIEIAENWFERALESLIAQDPIASVGAIQLLLLDDDVVVPPPAP